MEDHQRSSFDYVRLDFNKKAGKKSFWSWQNLFVCGQSTHACVRSQPEAWCSCRGRTASTPAEPTFKTADSKSCICSMDLHTHTHTHARAHARTHNTFEQELLSLGWHGAGASPGGCAARCALRPTSRDRQRPPCRQYSSLHDSNAPTYCGSAAVRRYPTTAVTRTNTVRTSRRHTQASTHSVQHQMVVKWPV